MAKRVDTLLKDYRAKRDFSKTAEPDHQSASGADDGGLRFVVQKHDATRLHYDFRLEWDGVLKSWAVTRGPSYDPAEKRLAVRLLTRTTRRVSPTELGLAYYDRARAVLEDAAEADSMVTAMQATPRGSLRISAPVSFGIGQISRAVARFLEAYPQVEVNMVLDDRFVELLAEGFDLAIRIGVLEDSTLKARKLAETRLLLAASPAYLAERGVPQSIDDLNDHCLLHYSNLSTGNFWRLRGRGGAERQIRVGGRFTANNGESLRKVAEAGHIRSVVEPLLLRSLLSTVGALLFGQVNAPDGPGSRNTAMSLTYGAAGDKLAGTPSRTRLRMTTCGPDEPTGKLPVKATRTRVRPLLP